MREQKRIEEGINKVCSAVHQTLSTSYYSIFTACCDVVYVYANDCRSDTRLREFKQLPQSLCLSNFCYGILFPTSPQDSIHEQSDLKMPEVAAMCGLPFFHYLNNSRLMSLLECTVQITLTGAHFGTTKKLTLINLLKDTSAFI